MTTDPVFYETEADTLKGLNRYRCSSGGLQLPRVLRRCNLLQAAHESEEKLELVFEQAELELRIAMFGIGAANIPELRVTDRLLPVRS